MPTAIWRVSAHRVARPRTFELPTMIQVGLTGNVASGKSTVSRLWASAGVPVVSADDLARDAVAPGGPAQAEIRELFGDEAFRKDGSLDRDRMRQLAFRDPEARRRLEGALHPHIRVLRERWLESRRLEGAPLVISEVPLLFEVGIEELFDDVVVVDAPEQVREERLVLERGISREEARRILAAQGDPELKLARADHVIRNGGTLQELEVSALRVLAELRVCAQQDGDR